MNINLNKCWRFLTIIIVVFYYNQNVYSQIKVGDNPTSINADAALEIESEDKGLLLPRLELNKTNSPDPLQNFVQGMFVYNTITKNDVTKGVYYSDGVKWIKVSPAITSGVTNAWDLEGNTGTQATQSFLGTTDAAPLVVKTNSEERLRVTETGKLGIGTSTPNASLHVNGDVVIDSLSTGNTLTDNVVLSNSLDGRLKKIPSSSFVLGVKKRTELVQIPKQSIFNTPALITDDDKIQIYRNGVLIAFTVFSNNAIKTEMPCMVGDEIKIIQLK